MFFKEYKSNPFSCIFINLGFYYLFFSPKLIIFFMNQILSTKFHNIFENLKFIIKSNIKLLIVKKTLIIFFIKRNNYRIFDIP